MLDLGGGCRAWRVRLIPGFTPMGWVLPEGLDSVLLDMGILGNECGTLCQSLAYQEAVKRVSMMPR